MRQEHERLVAEQDGRLRAAFRMATREDAELAGEARRIADKIGVAPELAESDINVARQVAKERAADLARMRKDYPTLFDEMRNPAFLRISSDDLDNLKATEGTFDFLGRNWEKGELQTELGWIGLRQLRGVSTPEEDQRAEELELVIGRQLPGDDGFMAATAEVLGQMSETVPVSLAAGAAAAGAASLGGPVSSGAAFAIGAGTATFSTTGMIGAGHAYRSMIRRGIPKEKAAVYALGSGALEGAWETLGQTVAIGPFQKAFARGLARGAAKAGAKGVGTSAFAEFVTDYAKTFTGEVGTEMAQTLTGSMVEDAAAQGVEGAKPGEDLGAAMWETFEKTAKAMAVLSTPGPAMSFMSNIAAAERTKAATQALNQIKQEAEASLVKDRDPAAYSKAVTEMAKKVGDGNVYLNAPAVVEAFRQADKAELDAGNLSKSLADQAEAAMPGFSEKLEEAARRGDDITIPFGEWAGKLANTKAGEALAPHLRVDANGLSPEEAKSAVGEDPAKAMEEAEKLANDEVAKAEQWDEESRAIETDVAQQIIAAGRSRGEARAHARLTRSAIETIAEKVGATPKELWSKYGVKVQKGEVPAGEMKQGGSRGGYDPTTRTITLKPGKDGADFSTFSHELGHALLSVYEDLAQHKAHPTILDDFRTFLKWAGEDEASWAGKSMDQKRKAHENFAANFEGYLLEGKAPEPALARLFATFAKFLRRVYGLLMRERQEAAHRKEFGEELLPLSDDIRSVMDRMLASEEKVQTTLAIRGALPIWQNQAESGLDDVQWADYEKRRQAADDSVVGEMALASVADVRWLRNAKAGKLREVQAKAAKTREGVRQQVAKEVEQRPVYKAIRWLKTGEFVNPDGTKTTDEGKAKFDREAVRRMLGIADLDAAIDAEPEVAPALKVKRGPSLLTRIKQLGGISTDSWNKSWPGEKRGEFRLPFVVRPKGMRWEAMASQLRSEGYAPPINGEAGVGSGDSMWLVDALSDATNGVATYSQNDEGASGIRDTRNPAEESPEERADRLEAERMDREQEQARRAAIQTAKPENEFRKLRGLVRKDGIDPDTVASIVDTTGQTNGVALVNDILKSKPIEEVIERETDARMLRDHGNLADPRKVEERIEAALHNEARMRFAASELNVLRKIGQPTRVTLARAKLQAEAALAKRKVGEVVNLRAFTMAARRASQRAQEAMAAKDFREAIRAKEQQVLQSAMADVAAKIPAEVKKGVAALKEFDGKDLDQGKRRVIDYVYAGRALATAYKVQEKPETTQEAELIAKGLETVKADAPMLWERLSPLLRSHPVDLKELSLAEFREVVEVAEWLWKAGKDAAELNAEGKRIAMATAVEALNGEIALRGPRTAPGAVAPGGETPGKLRRGILKMWNLAAGLKRMEHWARFMDGGKEGAFTRFFVAPIARALTVYRTHQRELVKSYHDSLVKLQAESGALWDARIEAKELGFTFKGKKEILGALLHAGSDSNLAKLLRGRKWGEMVMDGEAEVLDTSRWDRTVAGWFADGTLTKSDVEFLRATWKLYAGLLPQAQKAHKALYGAEFETIELRAVSTPFGMLNGGYVPARIDRDAATPDSFKDADTLSGAEAAFRYSINTGKGFTLNRNPSYNQPLDLDLGRQLSHFDQELRFIFLQPAVNDAFRITKNKEFAAAINSYDREAVNSIIQPWLENVALQTTNRPSGMPWLDTASTILRNAASVVALGFNLANSLVQITGISNALSQVKGSFLRSALATYAKNPREATLAAREKSAYMTNRADTTMRAMRDEVDRLTQPSIGKKARQAVGRWAFLPQSIVQGAADTVTWHGGYAQAIADGKTETEAVEAADAAVRRSQGSQNPEDMARYETGAPFVRLFTQFGSYSNLVLNQILSAQGVRSKAGAALWVLLLPALMEGTMRLAFKGAPEDEDDDGMIDEWASHYGTAVARNVAGLLPFGGPLLLALAQSEGSRVIDAPGISIIGQGVRGIYSLIDALPGGDDFGVDARGNESPTDLLNLINLASILTGTPLASPVRTGQQLVEAYSGER